MNAFTHPTRFLANAEVGELGWLTPNIALQLLTTCRTVACSAPL